jgi:formate hydrogenlyase subunit 3/multisubunit Na+/H+ antiporter MnhD subunit
VLAAFICLAAVLLALRPIPSLPVIHVGQLTLSLALPALHRAILQALLLCALYLVVLSWWLPGGQTDALWSLLALPGLALPLFVSDDLLAVCALLVAAAALAPALARGEDDGGAALFLGMAILGVACVALGLIASRSVGGTAPMGDLALARLLVVAGFALLLGVAPAPFWLPGLTRQGYVVGATLAAAGFPLVVLLVLLRIATGSVPFAGWLTAGVEAQAIVAAGLLTIVAGCIAALVQDDVRRLAGFLLVADMGYTVVGIGVALGYGELPYTVALIPLLGRALGVTVLLPALAFVSSGFRCALRPALTIAVACGAWMSLGGPLTLAFPLRWAVLERVNQMGGLLAACTIAGVLLTALAWLLLVVRAWETPAPESSRPCPRLVLLLMGAVVVVSLMF